MKGCILYSCFPISPGSIHHLSLRISHSFPHSFLQMYLFNCTSFVYATEARYCGFEVEKHFENFSDNHGSLAHKNSSFILACIVEMLNVSTFSINNIKRHQRFKPEILGFSGTTQGFGQHLVQWVQGGLKCYASLTCTWVILTCGDLTSGTGLYSMLFYGMVLTWKEKVPTVTEVSSSPGEVFR